MLLAWCNSVCFFFCVDLPKYNNLRKFFKFYVNSGMWGLGGFSGQFVPGFNVYKSGDEVSLSEVRRTHFTCLFDHHWLKLNFPNRSWGLIWAALLFLRLTFWTYYAKPWDDSPQDEQLMALNLIVFVQIECMYCICSRWLKSSKTNSHVVSRVNCHRQDPLCLSV